MGLICLAATFGLSQAPIPTALLMIAGALMGGTDFFFRKLPAFVDGIVGRISGLAKLLNSPEVQAAEHTTAGPAVEAAAAEASRLECELIAMDLEGMEIPEAWLPWEGLG
jgi:hypothetical protein